MVSRYRGNGKVVRNVATMLAVSFIHASFPPFLIHSLNMSGSRDCGIYQKPISHLNSKNFLIKQSKYWIFEHFLHFACGFAILTNLIFFFVSDPTNTKAWRSFINFCKYFLKWSISYFKGAFKILTNPTVTVCSLIHS